MVTERSPDPFLWAHGLRGHIFDIATGLRPASVRDQITRARLLIRRAWETGIIAPDPKRPILICGGGIAGVTCALEALQYGVRVVLIEQEAFPFVLQRRCITRLVDPNLYDWPAQHWQRHASYPSERGDRVELSFHADERPRDVARRWARYLAVRATFAPDLLDIRYRTTITHVTPELDADKMHTVTLATVPNDRDPAPPPPSPLPLTAAMVIFAEGPGAERDTLQPVGPSFRGYRFWDTDPFAEEPLRAKRFLIAGSGDGALQDFLRLVLKPSTSLRRFLSRCKIPAEQLAKLQACRQHNVAAFLWCADQRHEHENDLFVHQRHQEIIDELFATRSTRKPLLHALKHDMRKHLPEIVLAHACEHFTHGYPLNRFLVLLVARGLRELGYANVRFRPNTFVTAVRCQHELAVMIPKRQQRREVVIPPGQERRRRARRYCYAQPHRVTFGAGQCFDRPPSQTWGDDAELFDAVILRLGVKEEVTLNLPRDREKPLRQLLPTHLAHQPPSTR